jgi:predicted nucleotidyltransferase
MGEVLEARRTETQSRLAKLRTRLRDAAHRTEGRVRVYITGSFGRGEASKYSDLDLFIVGVNTGVKVHRHAGVKIHQLEGQWVVVWLLAGGVRGLPTRDQVVHATFDQRQLNLPAHRLTIFVTESAPVAPRKLLPGSGAAGWWRRWQGD